MKNAEKKPKLFQEVAYLMAGFAGLCEACNSREAAYSCKDAKPKKSKRYKICISCLSIRLGEYTKQELPVLKCYSNLEYMKKWTD